MWYVLDDDNVYYIIYKILSHTLTTLLFCLVFLFESNQNNDANPLHYCLLCRFVLCPLHFVMFYDVTYTNMNGGGQIVRGIKPSIQITTRKLI